MDSSDAECFIENGYKRLYGYFMHSAIQIMVDSTGIACGRSSTDFMPSIAADSHLCTDRPIAGQCATSVAAACDVSRWYPTVCQTCSPFIQCAGCTACIA